VAKKLAVARISYINTDPFFTGWRDGDHFKTLAATPRQLGRWAKDGKVDAGLLSLVDFWKLEGEFEPVADFGIAVKKAAQSVLLFSRRPLEDVSGGVIGVTEETSTSVELLKIILKYRWGLKASLRAGFKGDDAARLLIGDAALQKRKKGLAGFPHVSDLAEVWHAWQKRPFVFARWAVRKNVAPYLKQELAEALDRSLAAFAKNKPAAARQARRETLTVKETADYLSGFRYRLGRAEEESQTLFRDYLTGKAVHCVC
jgi:chorismate dehydratase